MGGQVTQKIVVRDEHGVVVHIGPWDERVEEIETSQLEVDERGFVVQENGKPKLKIGKVRIVRSPMPAGYKQCTAECVRDEQGGWHAVENYASTRQAHYPATAEQLDALWKGFGAALARIASLEGQVAELRDAQSNLPEPPPLREDLARDLAAAESMRARVAAVKAKFAKPGKH